MKNLIFISLFFIPFCVNAQTIRGRVTDASGLTPLQGVQIAFENGITNYNDYTQADGKFRLANIAAGRYKIIFTKDKYQTYTLEEVLSLSGKEIVLEVKMLRISSPLQIIEVSAVPLALGNLNANRISVEQTQRYATVNDDVARAATYLPGVMAVNDGTNHISVNGHSPNDMGWYVNDLMVINPNHLANAGTISDRPATAGGGISMLSSNMLSHTNFYNGIFDIQFSNSLGGAFSNYLRKGNNEKFEYAIQGGLVGVDAAIEGPINKKSGASFLVNYRYSFTGILAAMGVTFGGEDIRFQDLSFNIHLPVKQNNDINIFAVAGANSTYFSVPKDSAEWTSQKFLTNAGYYANTILAGASWLHAFKNNNYLKAVIGINMMSDERKSAPANKQLNYNALYNNTSEKNYLPYHVFYNHSFGIKQNLRVGIIGRTGNAKQEQQSAIDKENLAIEIYNRNYTLQQHNPYIDYKLQASKKFAIELAVKMSMVNDASKAQPNYLGKIIFKINEANQLQYAANMTSQLIEKFVSQNMETQRNDFQPSFNNSLNHSIIFAHLFKNNALLKTELYYQQLNNIAVSAGIKNSFSTLNDFETSTTQPFVNTGTGTNYGVNINYMHPLSNHFYYMVSVSVFDAKYRGSDNIERHTRYANNHTTNFAGGYEWKNKKANKIFGISAHALYAGGMRYTPIDIDQSELAQQTIVYDIAAFSLQQKDYFRTDLRFTYRVNRTHHNFLFALDIQNLAGNMNTDYFYYDIYLKKVAEKKQISTVPIMSVKYSF